MGLDTYKYQIVKDNQLEDNISSVDLIDSCLKNDLHYVIFSEHQEYSSENNKRLIDMFNKFKQYTKTVIITDCIDYEYYSKKHGKEITELDWAYGNSIEDKYSKYKDNAEFKKIYDEYNLLDENDKDAFNVVLYILISNNEVVECVKDIKTCACESKYLLFEQVGYMRSGEMESLYDIFYGDCWYKKENTGLNMDDARHFVYPSELDELKLSYNKDSFIQTWDLTEDEVIYINP